MPFESFAIDVRHLLSMQYSAVEVRLRALEDVLSGPDHLHDTIGNRLSWVRQTRGSFSDAQVQSDLTAFPDVRRPNGHKDATEPKFVAESLVRAGLGVLRQFAAVRPGSNAHPEAEVAAMEARWWRLTNLDSALVSASDGTGASWYKRDRRKFSSMLLRSILMHRKLLRNWDSLSETYHEALPGFTSRDTWARTFASATADEEPGVK
jgi:galactofuranosylgalactofuranosylrhamnosyl-N-acetylglucosaminyl-diphospho-decaprenol beta-1,5/1,6-galactofuranosyltransferase